ncbi:hypothetical protein BDQ17DRAFT_1280385 [Cyathus striatus]|nr:hypothetical protein BDQ17DRAFT_1280385 [Cyathus striatus]
MTRAGLLLYFVYPCVQASNGTNSLLPEVLQLSNHSSTSNSLNYLHTSLPPLTMPEHECQHCDEPATKRCSGCSKVWYCGSRCQIASWDFHIFNCNPRCAINTAHHLARAAYNDMFPGDHQTLIDYGFTRACTPNDRSNLLGLYMGLIRGMEIPSKSLHKWRIEGRLVSEIKAAYEGNRTGYYDFHAWFLENQWILDDSIPPPVGDPQLYMFRNAWEYAVGGGTITSVEEVKKAISKWSRERQTCFLLCTSILSEFPPLPSEPQWLDFGFCTCPELEDGWELGKCYMQLLDECTFDEFCFIYTAGTLHLRLMNTEDIKLLNQLLCTPRVFPHLEQFLNNPFAHYSVWDLKQFVVAAEGSMEPAMPIMVDYGFINCKDNVEMKELKEVYKAYFSARDRSDPAELHQACIQGKIFDHVGSVTKLSDKFKILMKNMYPLPNH